MGLFSNPDIREYTSLYKRIKILFSLFKTR